MAREVIDIIIQERGGRIVVDRIREVGRASQETASRVNTLRNTLRLLGGSLVVREILRSIDSYARMNNQLRILGYNSIQAAQAQRELFDIAQQTRQPLEATVTLYGRLGQSAQDLGRSEQELMRFTELTGMALAVQGTTAQGARGALTQLSQAMGEGIVRAQEFNSMVENARPLLLAAARGITEAGGTIAGLRRIMLDGELTSQRFFDGVLAGGAQLQADFASTAVTMDQALTQVKNAFTVFLGESLAGQLIMQAIAGTLQFLALNFEQVATAAMVGGTAFALYWGLSTVGAATSALWGAIRAQQALNIALGATGASATFAAAAVKYLTAVTRGFMLALLANPLGLFIAAIALAAYGLYSMRDAMVTVGNSTASVGNIMGVVWDRVIGWISDVWTAIQTWVSNTLGAVADMTNQLLGWFASWGISGADVANTLIAVFKSFVDITIGNFRTLYQVGIAVLQGLASVGRNIMAGLAAGISGDFAGAAAAFGAAFSTDNFDFSGVTASVEQTAQTVADNFSTDWVSGISDGINAGREAIVTTFEGVVAEAALRGNVAAQAFQFPTGGTTPPGTGGGGGGGGSSSRTFASELADMERQIELARQWGLQQEINNNILEMEDQLKRRLTDTERALLTSATQRLAVAEREGQILEELRGPMEELAIGQAALNNLIAAGSITLAEYNSQLRAMKVEAGTAGFADAFIFELERMSAAARNFAQSAGTIFGNFFSTLSRGIANSIGRAIVYAEDLGEALSNVAKEALSQLISAFVELGIQYVLNQILATTTGAAATAASAAMAATTASAWAPAAAMASLASMGGNAAPAQAAVASTVATTRALALKDGGEVAGKGTGRSDSISAWLSNGEFVVNAKSTAMYRPLLQAINEGRSLSRVMPRFRDGGEYTGSANARTTTAAKTAEHDVRTTARADDRNDMPAGAPNVEVPITQVNLLDPALLGKYMNTADGRRVLINVLTEEGVING